jgi:hypothetical protein
MLFDWRRLAHDLLKLKIHKPYNKHNQRRKTSQPFCTNPGVCSSFVWRSVVGWQPQQSTGRVFGPVLDVVTIARFSYVKRQKRLFV